VLIYWLLCVPVVKPFYSHPKGRSFESPGEQHMVEAYVGKSLNAIIVYILIAFCILYTTVYIKYFF